MSTDPNDPDYDPDEALKAAEKNAQAAQRALKDLEKQSAERDARLAELEKKEQMAARIEAFKQAGLSPKQAEWYPADAELSPEKIKEFAEAHDLVAAAPAAAAPTNQGQPFVSVPAGTPAGGSTKISEAELDRLMKVNPQRAIELANTNQVEWSEATLNLSRSTP